MVTKCTPGVDHRPSPGATYASNWYTPKGWSDANPYSWAFIGEHDSHVGTPNAESKHHSRQKHTTSWNWWEIQLWKRNSPEDPWYNRHKPKKTSETEVVPAVAQWQGQQHTSLCPLAVAEPHHDAKVLLDSWRVVVIFTVIAVAEAEHTTGTGGVVVVTVTWDILYTCYTEIAADIILPISE